MAERITGLAVGKTMREGPLEQLSDTRYTQPAMLLDGYVGSSDQTLFNQRVKPTIEKYEEVAFVGNSVGELTALLCAEALPLEEMLRLVHKRSQLMSRVFEHNDGRFRSVSSHVSRSARRTADANSSATVQRADRRRRRVS